MLFLALAAWGYYVAKFDYVKAQATAKKLVEKFGESGSFTRTIQGAIDPATGEQGASTEIKINGAVTPVLRFSNDEVNGESVQRDDGFVFFDGDELAINDKTTINGETWRCVDVSKIKSVSGVLVYQKVQLRR